MKDEEFAMFSPSPSVSKARTQPFFLACVGAPEPGLELMR
jgi:hypothetical protein